MANNSNNPNSGNMTQTSSIIPQEAFNTTLQPGLNPGDFYNILGDGCTMQGCVPNVVNHEKYNIPSVEEIAAYNNQVVRGRAPGSSPITTPATTFDYGATIEQGITDGITDIKNPFPVTAESLQYLNGFLRTQIGRRVSIDFLVGSNTIITKTGFLLGVATNYILINELDTNDLTTCDFYNIKFIRFYY